MAKDGGALLPMDVDAGEKEFCEEALSLSKSFRAEPALQNEFRLQSKLGCLCIHKHSLAAWCKGEIRNLNRPNMECASFE